MEPTIGRIVIYKITAEQAGQINVKRRTLFQCLMLAATVTALGIERLLRKEDFIPDALFARYQPIKHNGILLGVSENIYCINCKRYVTIDPNTVDVWHCDCTGASNRVGANCEDCVKDICTAETHQKIKLFMQKCWINTSVSVD